MATNITTNATAGYVADTGSIESILILLLIHHFLEYYDTFRLYYLINHISWLFFILF